MKKLIFPSILWTFSSASAQVTDTLSVHYKEFDTVTISALGRQSYTNIPYTIHRADLQKLQETPRPQLMNQLSRLPSVSSISSGNGINKPVVRGLSFNHLQLFAQGTRIDNQTWDDRHDI